MRRKCGPLIHDDRYETRCSRNAQPEPDPVDGLYYCHEHGPTNARQKPFVQKTYACGAELVDITHALALADELEDQERLRKMELADEDPKKVLAELDDQDDADRLEKMERLAEEKSK
jgi:hypothetical protein